MGSRGGGDGKHRQQESSGPGLSPERLRGGRFPVRKAQVFPLEPSASCCEGEKLDEPQDRPWSMGLASRATLRVGVLFAFTFLGPGLETRGIWSSTRKQQAVP